MSNDVYKKDKDKLAGENLPAHIKRLSEKERFDEFGTHTVWKDEKTGFLAGAYRNTTTGEITIAFAGTIDGKDWKNNVQQGFNGDAPQYKQARRLAYHVSKVIPQRSGTLSFTGHSLGGGLALEAVESFNTSFHRDAKVFNGAGLRRHPLEFG
ncbi:MAG: hypothetical protein ACJAR9_002071 [Celeribacter sp.]|jgi:hypothetical protein